MHKRMAYCMDVPTTTRAAVDIVAVLMSGQTCSELDIGDAILEYLGDEVVDNETSVLDASVHKVAHALAHDPVSAIALVEAILIALQ